MCHFSLATLIKGMACCLTSPIRYLDWYWHHISKDTWASQCILCEMFWVLIIEMRYYIRCTKLDISQHMWAWIRPRAVAFLMVHFVHNFSCDQAALQMVFSVRLSVCPSVCLSVCPSICLSHLFDYVPIIVSSWNFQELLPMTKVRSMQKVKVKGQRSRSQSSQPNLTVSGM